MNRRSASQALRLSIQKVRRWPAGRFSRFKVITGSTIAITVAALMPPTQFQVVWAAGNYPVVVASDSPIGYWRLDETSGSSAADSSSGHANPLTYQGGYSLGAQPGAISGDPDPGVALNGSSGAVTAAKATTTTTTNWSLEAWLNPSTLPQTGVVAYDGQMGTNGFGFAVGATNGTTLSSGSHLIGIVGGVTMFDSGYNFASANTWYHVVMTRDTTTIRLYANAVQQTTTSTSAPVAPGARFSLGSGFTSTSSQIDPFAGSIDEAASYNSTLSAGRILAHYTEGAAVQSAFGNWVSVSPSNPPTARYEPAMGWDAAHNKVVLFGGKNSSGTALQETWTWDGTTWTKLTPATQPTARWGAQLVYDTSLGKMVLFGGNSGKKALQETWTWDGTTWAQLSPSSSPSARYEYGLAYDAANSVVVLFGGFSGSAALQDTWTFNGTTWTSKSPTTKPSIRSQVAMTYNTAAGNTVLFGGVSGTTYNAETWTWNGTNWTQKTPTGAPSARADSGLAYNSLTSTVVLVGGVNGSTYSGDTWTWDGTNWTQQLPASSPTVRAGAGFAYNGVIGADSLFGGLSGSTYLNDTKAWATPPAAPTGVIATAGNAQATVSWSAPANGGSAITGYVVTPYAGSQPGTSSTPSASPVTITGLTNGTSYTFKVYAKNAIGNGPAAVSNAVTPATVPGAPTGVSAVPGNNAATVSWTAPSSNGGSAITSYTVTGSPSGSATLTCPCTPPLQQTVSSLTNGTSYTFTVTATNSAGTGSASSPPSTAITVGAPTAPQTPSATAGANQATVSWTAPASSNGSSVSGYVVTAYLGTTAENRVNTNASTTSVVVSGLVGSSQYTFQIVATNSFGSGPAATTNAVTPTGSTSTYFATVRGDSPTAYWRLDDPSGTIASDSSGNGHDGTYNGGITYSSSSLIPSDADPAVTLDGGGSTSISAPNLTPLQGDNTRSVELWFRTSSGSQQALFDSGSSSCGTTGQAFDVFLTQPGLYGNPPHNTAGIDVAFCSDDVYLPDLNLGDGNFHHVVVTLSGSSVGVYVDGRAPQGAVWNGSSWTALGNQPFTLPTTPNTAAGGILMGASHGVAGGHFNGTLDEVAVYSTVLTSTQVTNHENAAQVTLSAPVIGTVTPGANQITITWTDSSNAKAFNGYTVTAYSGSTATVSKAVAPSATTATLTGLIGGTPYTIKVALSNSFSSFSTTSSAVTPTGAASTYASTVQATVPAPIFYYRLSDTGTTIVADSSGNGQTATYVGTPTLGAGGALANDTDPSVTFGSGYVSYSGASIPTGNTARSVELWLKTSSTAWNQQLIGWGDGNNFGTDFDVRYNGGTQISINVFSSHTNPYINLPYSLSNGQWHQLILTWDGSTFVVYVDGNRAGSNTYGGISTDRTGVSIGNGFQGSLDEVVVYSGLLTGTQAMAHFLASGNSQVAPPATVTATAGANAATVTWTASPSNPYPVLGYFVTAYNGTQAANSETTGPSATSATITGLQGGVAYTFSVAAINNFGIGTATSSTAVTPTGAASTYASTVIGTGPSGNGPVAYWRLGDLSGTSYAADSSGNGAWGNYRSGTTLGGGGALTNDSDTSLSGSMAYGTGNGFPFGNTSRTVELWLKTTSTAGMTLVSWGDAANFGTDFIVSLTNGYRVWVNLNNQTNPAINAPYSLANGQWHYVVLTWSGSAFTLYVDGTAAGTWSQGGIGTDSSPVLVGVDNNGNAPFSGNLDEVAVYNRVLGQSEITAHFLASGNSQPAAPPAGSVGASAGTNQATVSWQSVTNPSAVTGYVVTAYSGSVEQESTITSAGVSSVVMSGLPAGISYTFSVAAVNNFGIGASTTSTAVTPTGNSTTYLSTVMSSGPLVYYRLDDGEALAADSSGNNLLGNYTGAYSLGAQGALNGDPDTAMSGGGLQVNQISGFPFNAAARTIEVWFKTTSTSNQTLATYGDGNWFGTLFSWQITSSANQLTLGTTTTSWSFNTPYNVADGKWHMADVTYDGTNLTMYVDGASIGSQSIGGLSTDSGTVFATGNFSGSLDELSVYTRALTAADASNHWQAAGAGVPGAPTNVTATPGASSAVVSWTAPAALGGPITSFTITPQVAGGPALAPLTVTGSTHSANVPNLPGGTSMTFAVAAVNKYGTGPSTSSSAVTILGYAGSPGMDRFLAIATGGNPARGIYYEGWTSNSAVSATTLTNWTIEGWMWAINSKNTTTGNMAWGLLNTFSYRNPNGALITLPSPDVPVAGINFNIGDLHGLNNCCWVSFNWPHNGNTGFGTDGQYIPSTNLGAQLSLSTPTYLALDYDGTNVRGYINGTLIFTQADSAAIPFDSPAGFMDQTELGSGAFDGFRISNVARYTSSSFSVPMADTTADSNTLVDYNFDNYPVGKQPSILLTPFTPYVPVGTGNWPDSSSNHNSASFIGVSDPWEVGWYADSALLFQPFELTPGIAPGELADECDGVNTGSGNFCQRSTDLSVPGRGPQLSLQRTYNSFGASTLGTFGYGWSSTYGAHLSVDGSGNVTVYDTLGGSEFFQNQGGSYGGASYVSTVLTFSGGNYTLTEKGGLKLVFNSTGQLIQEIDRDGYTTTLAYVSGNLSTVTEPAGRQLTYTYGTNGLVASVSDGTRTVTYSYDGNQNLISVTNVLGGVTTYSYDSSHRMLSEQDPVCTTTTGCNGLVNVYDTNGRVSKQTDPVGNISTYSYVQSWPLFTTTLTDPLGHQNKYDYALGIPIDVTLAANTSLAATTTFTYDPASMGVASVTNPNSETSTATYDAKTNQLSSTDPLGNTVSYTYNGFGQRLTVQDPMHVTTTTSYDANGNILSVSTPLASGGPYQVTTYTYGDSFAGDVTAVTDATNRTTTYAYDVYGNRISEVDPAGDKTTFVYDPLGRMTSTVSPLGNVVGANAAAYTTSYTYNAAGEPLKVTDPLGNFAVKQYDAAGRLTQATDPNGNVTTFSYDLDGRPTSSTSGFGTPQATNNRTAYDGAGNVTSQIDGLTHTLASYTYDALNREATMADGLNRTTSYGYDAANRLISILDPLSKTTTYAYDSGGRLASTTYLDGVTPPVAYTYDADGWILTMVDGTGTTTNVWDALHRLSQQTDGAGHVVGYAYDLAGRITSIAYPGGNCSTSTLCVTRQYDSVGRVSSIRDWLSNQTTFSFDANSNMTGVTLQNGITGTWTYSNANQLTGISDVKGGNAFLSLSYTRDSNSQVSGENANGYSYNSLNQLTGGAGIGYTYDAAGRVTQTVNGSTTTNYTYDNADQLLSTSIVGGSTTSYAYDSAGRRITAGSTSLTWDQAGRLLTFGSSTSYKYNGAGLRVSKTVGGQTEAFVWDAAESMPTMLQDGTTSYVTAPGGLPLEQINGSTAYFYLPDQQGSTRAITDATGSVVATYTYDAYGNITAETGTVTSPLLFNGQYLDAESGLYYLRARYYDPTTAQFISRDPKLASTGTPYAYVSDNPMNMADPSGLCGLDFWNCDIGGAIGGAIANAWNGFTGMVNAAWTDFTTRISSFIGQAGTFLVGFVTGFTSSVASAVTTWLQGAHDALSSIGNGIQQAAIGVKNFFDTHPEIRDGLAIACGVIGITLAILAIAWALPVLAVVGLAFAVTAVVIDAVPCSEGDQMACVATALGAVGVVASIPAMIFGFTGLSMYSLGGGLVAGTFTFGASFTVAAAVVDIVKLILQLCGVNT